MNKDKKGFSIIEVLVWIFVFSLWITSVYAIILSTLKLNDYNENYIISSNLAREQIELFRNIRDSNYKNIKPYNLKNPSWSSYEYSDKFEYDKKYTIENNYSSTANFPIKVESIDDFWEWEWQLNNKMRHYTLCLDSENRYTHSCPLNNKKTEFYKYISIEKPKYNDTSWSEINIENSILIRSKVIWYKKWYHEFELKSIIADWKRL